MNTNTITLTPEQFVTMFLPFLIARDAQAEVAKTAENYFVRNTTTGLIELNITKDAYKALDADTKKELWASYRWSRSENRWISRYEADPQECEEVIDTLRLSDAGKIGDDAKESGHHVDETPAPKAVTHTKPQVTPEQKPKASAVSNAGFRVTQDEIEYVLRGGSGYEDGKIRIAAYYASDHTPTEAEKFLAKEYGIGGRSHTFLDGVSGCVDYRGKGLEITYDGWTSGKKVLLSWVTVHSYLRDMIRNGRYLTEAEQKKLNEIKAKCHGKLPTPRPCMRYPLENTSV